jgi:hypothetical protein
MEKDNKSEIVADKALTAGKGKLIVYLSLVLLFIISFTYFYWFGNGVFFYQENRTLFIFSADYLQKFTEKPGGLLVYAGNFLTQGYFNALYGSLLVSVLLILISVFFIKIIRQLSADRSYSLFLILLPSCLLLLLQTRYDLFIHQILGFLLVNIWFLVSIVLAGKKLRFIILIIFPVFYYLVGTFALIYMGIYIMFSVIYEKGIFRYYFPCFLIPIAFSTFIVFKEVLFLQPDDQLIGYPLFFNDSSRLTRLLVILSGVIILFPLFIKNSGVLKLSRKFEQVIPLATIVVTFPLIILLLFKFYNPDLENLAQLEKSVFKQDWNAVIRHHERFPSANIIGQYYYNLALAEKDQLCERMFFGQQSFGPMSLTLPRDDEHLMRAIYFYYAVGLVSEAHHLAYEMMVQHGYTPENIKLLIKTELIDGNYKIAERYINVLKRTLHYKAWAEKYGKMLINHELINSDPELSVKIRLLPKKDFFVATNDVQNIELLLKDFPDNKIAFEYKIARLLLEKDLLEVVSEVKKMKAIGYTTIPRHVEEAVLELINVTKELPDLGGLYVRSETERRFIEYQSILNSYRGNKSSLEKAMKKTEKNTFWYYLHFNVIKSVFFEKKPVEYTIY